MLCDVVFILHKLVIKTKKIVLEKLFSRKVLSFSKTFSCKGKSGASKIKSITENLARMIYKRLILELYFGTFPFSIRIVLFLWR